MKKMKKTKKITKIKNSFINAINGLVIALIKELNVRISFLLILANIILNIFFKVTLRDWGTTIFVGLFVLSFELMNTSIEMLIDLYFQKFNIKVKAIKDLSASAVLISLISYLIINCIIYLSYI